MSDPRRALVLPGGGARVAWQAGAVLALERAGLSFEHLDGTSGGIMNTAALMSGVAPAELCARWVTLSPRRFVTPLPWRTYLRAPRLPALAGADGVRNHVFPHLGIDVAAIRTRQEPTATFNVTNFDEKISVALEHHEVSVDHLVAGLSLPIAMPAVARDGVTWTDAAWIRDSNLEACERRGVDEIWVLWCIGNTPRYGENPLEQYVNMIEMSAIGALNAELAAIAARNAARDRPVRVHVVTPAHPLPLDPWYLTGRIDGHTLVAMGYRDACAYLDRQTPDGVALDPSATKMSEPPLGVRVSSVAHGRFRGDSPIGGAAATLRTTAELHDVAGPAEAQRPAVGSMQLGTETHYLRDGTAWWDGYGLHVRGTMDLPDGAHRVESVRRALSGCEVTVDGPAGTTTANFRSTPAEVLRMVISVEPSAARSIRDRVRAVRALAALSRS